MILLTFTRFSLCQAGMSDSIASILSIAPGIGDDGHPVRVGEAATPARRGVSDGAREDAGRRPV
jgi:hypothetical protein